MLSLLRAAGLFLLVAPTAAAFSLLGPFEPWMLGRTEYTEVAGGGPVIPESAYRWNLPVITYGFDPQFRATFGEEGVEAVESAINLLRELPDLGSADAILLASFPTSAAGFNFAARLDKLVDLRSTALSALLQNLGLASPERYMFCLRASPPNEEEAEPYVLRRNYEPLTGLPSESINGAGFFYAISFMPVPESVSAVEMQNDFSEQFQTAVAFNEFIEGINNGNSRLGLYSRSLTRDDVGGLAYLWSTSRIVWEELPPDCHAPYGDEPLIRGARRPGVGRMEWRRQERTADGTGWIPLDLDFQDRFFKPEPAVQKVVRRVASPDLVFGVASGLPRRIKPLDMGFSEPFVTAADTSRWIRRSAENGRPGEVGPGQITPGAIIGFNPESVLTWQFLGLKDPPVTFPRLGVFGGTAELPIALLSPPPSPNCRFEYLIFLSDGRFHPAGSWTVEARPQGTYRVESSTDLVHWTSSSELSGEGGVHLVLDDAFATSGAHFMRIR